MHQWVYSSHGFTRVFTRDFTLFAVTKLVPVARIHGLLATLWRIDKKRFGTFMDKEIKTAAERKNVGANMEISISHGDRVIGLWFTQGLLKI